MTSLFVFSGLTSFFTHLNFCRLIKSLFTFNDLASFFIDLNYSSRIKTVFIFKKHFDEFFQVNVSLRKLQSKNVKVLTLFFAPSTVNFS